MFIFNFFSFTKDNSSDLTKGIYFKTIPDSSIMINRKIKDMKEYSDSKRWAFIIGINDYEDQFISDLKTPQNDAKVISDIFRNEGQFDYVFSFTDDMDKKSGYYPSLNNIKTKMEYLKEKINPEDLIVFLFSGHGISDENGKSYLLLADSTAALPYKTSLPLYEIEEWINTLDIKRNIVFLDACRNFVEKNKSINLKTISATEQFNSKISAIVYSTSPGEYSYENDAKPYGVFTTFLTEGLKGKADKNGDILISFNEIKSYVEEKVCEWSIRNNKRQTPSTYINGEFYGDIPLTIVPLEERAEYNPYSIKNNIKIRLAFTNTLRYTSLSLMTLSLTGSLVSGIILAAGYSRYNTLTVYDTIKDWDFYRGMTTSSLYCTAILGTIGLSFSIPFAVSYFINTKKTNTETTFNINFTNDLLTFGLKIKI